MPGVRCLTGAVHDEFPVQFIRAGTRHPSDRQRGAVASAAPVELNEPADGFHRDAEPPLPVRGGGHAGRRFGRQCQMISNHRQQGRAPTRLRRDA